LAVQPLATLRLHCCGSPPQDLAAQRDTGDTKSAVLNIAAIPVVVNVASPADGNSRRLKPNRGPQ
jgi:hypothetical protein